MVALALALGLSLGGGPSCTVTIDYEPLSGLATNQPNLPAPPSPLPSPPKKPPPVTWIRLNGHVLKAKLVKRVLPEYPKSACEGKNAGTVHLLVTVAKSGSIREAKVVEGDPSLSAAAVSAVKQWRYRPTRVNGNPVEVETVIYVRFLLSPPK